ncbi:hypothetical protein GCM10010531_03870 [Blastococcus jejuensis]|uniref:Uncharacterized protein n=1 Tax=Blastococcus jejuensis TaxID=351224 RepID=A0ABP6NQR7_9ACTN
MGKHAAPGSSSHPLVAAALAQRTAEGGAHRGGRRPASEGPVGWPGPSSPDGGGLGWPGDLPASDATDGDGEASDDPAPRAARRGWRRLLGQAPAA